MIYDYLIVGQGIAGSMVAYQAAKRNKTFFVVDRFNANSASHLATGVINPVTGRKMNKSWMIDTVLPYAKKMYRDIESEYDIHILNEQPVFRLFSSAQDEVEWNNKQSSEEYTAYLGEVRFIDNMAVVQPFKAGEIKEACWVKIPIFIDAFRERLKQQGLLSEAAFVYEDLILDDVIQYHNIQARKIIFCEGYLGIHNPYFQKIPLSHAKGEQLEFISESLQCEQILNKNLFILPLGDHHYLAASTFIWDDTEETVTDEGRQEILSKLNKMISATYEVVSEKAGIRPTMPDRRPVLGASPVDPRIFIFNGMGTKGISLAPYFSAHLLDHIEKQTPLVAECDIKRFKK